MNETSNDRRRLFFGRVSHVASTTVYLIVLMTSLPVKSTAAEAADRRPNIVIFIVDDLGIGDLGCFGNDTIQTPNIDRIAREGARLTHHLTPSAVCTPSRAALLTGRLPARIGMTAGSGALPRVVLSTTSAGGLPPNETTFATVAKRRGYRTALIGKWHLGVFCPSDVSNKFCHHPRSHGFDYYYGMPLSNAYAMHPGGGGKWYFFRLIPSLKSFILTNTLSAAAFCLVLVLWGVVRKKWRVFVLWTLLVSPSVVVYFYVTNQVLLNSVLMRDYEFVEQPIRWENLTLRLVREGIDFIERNGRHLPQQLESQQPFMLVMSWLQVHTKLHASYRFQGHSRHGRYGDEVEEMDWGVGQIVDCLERLNLLNDTLIFFTSDNGGHVEEIDEATGQRGGGWNGIYRGGKAQEVMDGGIRMPAVAMWRGHIPPGTVVNVPTSHMDLLPTLSAVWSEPLPEDRVIDGRNIYPLLTGASKEPPHRLLVHYCADDLQAVRYVPGNGDDVYKLYYATPNWKPGTQGCDYFCSCAGPDVIRHDPPLLYNIGRDPSETRMLSVDEHRDVVRKINDEVELHRKTMPLSVHYQLSVWNQFPRLWYLPCSNFPSCSCIDGDHADIAPVAN